ncbi:VOC family protein [Roseofilum reptotaenium CS-1145]|uniref:Glyoxalase n=2 Tax=Roseofilum TaxID=1233426 RepID=A0A1L9QY11_9CYAN|nr:VOC family protein [Roseofilum reptotaenium CS-1145]OJJ27575.1 glyoxalase [Roseofilum reptotaenium AO1-A]
MVMSELWVTIATENVETLRDFYRCVLNTQAQREIPGVYAEFIIGGLRLGLFRPRDRQEFHSSTPGSMSLCLEVEDIEDAIIGLSHLGYPPPGAIQTASHGREIYAYDPDGNRLIIHENR